MAHVNFEKINQSISFKTHTERTVDLMTGKERMGAC
jgi:hypothetical protein